MSDRIVVVTVAAGRHAHLIAQRAGLARSDVAPIRHVVVSMGDAALAGVLSGPATEVVWLPTARPRLPLAAARNLGAGTAIARGATLLVFLDVDVVPAPELLGHYAAAAAVHPGALLSGPVVYLPAGVRDPARFADHPPHPARPVPPPGAVWPARDADLFWSLSFALTPATWTRIGGFDTRYVGYGGEDTDFAYRAREAGVELAWVGGATGYHQHHPVSNPPVEHLDDVLCNGRLFYRRWGHWPMSGWLTAFEAAGLVRREGGDWVRVEPMS